MNIYSHYINFDLLRIPISLSYQKKYLYRTFIGATLTIIGLILLIIYFSIKLNQIIKKSLFTIISNEFQNPKDAIDLTNIPILFYLSDKNGNPIEFDSKIFELSVVLKEYIRDFDEDNRITYIEQRIEIERCDSLTHIKDFSYFSEYNISNFRCIKPYQNITIKGRYGDILDGYKALEINLKRCNNLYENCYNSNYIESFVSNTKFVVIYLGYKANFYNLNKKDIERAIYSRSISLSPFFFKKVLYYLTLAKYDNYDNFVSNNKKENIYFINRDMLVDIGSYVNSLNNIKDNDTFVFFSFVYDGNMIEYTKKVEKLGEIISYIGNFFNIMLTLFRMVNNYFSKKILFTDVFHNFFFEEKFKKKEKNVRFNDNFNNSNLFPLINKKYYNFKFNSKMQDKSIKSINSNLNINSYIPDKTFENDINKLNNSNVNKNGLKRILTNKSKIIEKEKINFKRETKFFYLCPLWVIKNRKNLNQLLIIKESICNSFSLESFIELIRIKKSLNALKKEKSHEIFVHKRNHLSDKNVMRNEMKEFLYYK